jgi:glucose-6-phosphate 1-dehydrogenase
MSAQNDPKPEPTILVIFGITGDLAGRYLLPAIYHLFKDGLLPEQTEIVGITRGTTTTEELFERVEVCVNEVDKVCDPEALAQMQQHTSMFQMDLDDPAAYDKLLQRLNAVEDQKGLCLNRLYYLSIPPAAYHGVVRLLGERGLSDSCQHNKAQTRLLVEKPFGYDLKSAEKLIAETAESFKEEQLFRIDHYLAKQTVRHILNFRLKNPGLEAIWNGEHVQNIDITASEAIGVEGRAKFYEPLGALRDFIQSHLMQIMGLVAMDLPGRLASGLIHKDKQALLEKVKPADPVQAVRGQYAGYREEVHNPESRTETYAAVTLNVDSSRWQNTTFRLATGKALKERKSEIVATFKNGGRLVFRIQPDEAISTDGPLEELTGPLDTDLSGGGPAHPDAYERVLLDAIRGDHTLFATSQEVLASWRALQPVIEAWGKSAGGLIGYKPGSAEPISGQTGPR